MPLEARTEALLRELAPRVLGAVIRRFHDFGASEEYCASRARGVKSAMGS